MTRVEALRAAIHIVGANGITAEAKHDTIGGGYYIDFEQWGISQKSQEIIAELVEILKEEDEGLI